jgi:hypothetical protein
VALSCFASHDVWLHSARHTSDIRDRLRSIPNLLNLCRTVLESRGVHAANRMCTLSDVRAVAKFRRGSASAAPGMRGRLAADPLSTYWGYALWLSDFGRRGWWRGSSRRVLFMALDRSDWQFRIVEGSAVTLVGNDLESWWGWSAWLMLLILCGGISSHVRQIISETLGSVFVF